MSAVATGSRPLVETHELSEAEYYNEVLQLPVEKSETHLDDEIISRAESLGIIVPPPIEALPDKRYTSSAQSASTAVTYHGRTFSTGSTGSASTALTAQSSICATSKSSPLPGNKKQPPKDLNFAQYERYLSKLEPILDQPKFRKGSVAADTSSKSLFSVSTKRSVFSIKSGLKTRMRWRRKSIQPSMPTLSCICCRDEFNKTSGLHNLPCGHTYCGHCLRVMAQQSISDEAKMPPRCCTQPIPGSIVKEILTREAQQSFLKAVVQFSTPWESRIFCPNSECGEFIPPRQKLDPKHPFNVTCRKCSTRACVMCKRNAHPVGKDCPEDYELEAVLKMGEKSGWRRCYKCRNLVELTQGCTHMTCRCKAQFCYICGGIWDATLGCPNVCNGEEELERRRLEEEERLAELEAEKAAEEAAAAAETAEKQEAVERSKNHDAFQRLAKTQEEELQRFLHFVETAKGNMQTRHLAQKGTMIEKHQEAEEKMKERHTKTANHLEDRQVAAEMELRTTLEQSERSVRIRLKHMEAYCDGLGRTTSAALMPARQVTERDLRELGQQYNLRDGMERLHQSKINVMRDRQAKRMEELLERQDTELGKLVAKSQEEIEGLAGQFADETEILNNVFVLRKKRVQRRWQLAIQILCRELENNEGHKYGEIPTPSWPSDGLDEGNDDRALLVGSIQS